MGVFYVPGDSSKRSSTAQFIPTALCPDEPLYRLNTPPRGPLVTFLCRLVAAVQVTQAKITVG